MERRQFVKKAGIFTTGAIALSGIQTYAAPSESTEKKATNIDLSPMLAKEKISIVGKVTDAVTLQPIVAKIKVTAKTNAFYSSKRNYDAFDGNYRIDSGFSSLGKTSQKVLVEIDAEGYKPYSNYIYLTKTGCSIHSNEWNYNPNFKGEDCPENKPSGNQIISSFNFRLIKL